LAHLNRKAEADSLLQRSRLNLFEQPVFKANKRLALQRAMTVYNSWGDSETAARYQEELSRLETQ